MPVVTCWKDFISRTTALFPECDAVAMGVLSGDVCALARHLADRHELTFAEAAELVALRLPVFVEEERRLSA
jgi:hypothetical protein